MQINRLFEIVYILLNKKIVTAKELSQRLEVSVRTIYRDIETLNISGVPVFMSKGKGGGISLLENFVLNKSILSNNEQNEILSALQSLKAINYPDIDNVISKLGMLFNKEGNNWIDVDFSDWDDIEREKFNNIKTAAVNRKTIIFDYFGSNGEKTYRTVEPLQLWFKQKNWYLKGHCLTKEAYRIFKLTRMKNVIVTDKSFDRVLPKDVFDETKKNTMNLVKLKLHLKACVTHRVYDEFDEDEITKNADGSFIVTATYPDDDWVSGYILSFGSNARVIEPNYIKDIVINKLEETLKQYKLDCLD